MHEPLPRRTVVQADVTITHVLHRDYETRSRVDLRKVGAHRYAADPSTEVLCVAYAVDDGPVQLWRRGDPIPAEFFDAAANPNWDVAAHDDHFESAIEQHRAACLVSAGRSFRSSAIVCTQAMCLAVGLPARLSAAADALELENRKDAAGERLMHQMSKPRRARQDEDSADVYWFEDARSAAAALRLLSSRTLR